MGELLVEQIEQFGLSKKDKPKNQFSKVGVVGCGTVGQSIAILVSAAGMDIIFIEVSEERINDALCEIEKELDRQIAHWGMTPSDKRAILSRIKGSFKYDDLKDCDIVIEAILSRTRDLSIDIRKGVFKSIERHVSPECIIATNSTTLIVTELSSELDYKERCVSLHILTTAKESRIVEIVKGLYTSTEVYEATIKFVRMLGKRVVQVEESPGLISVRLFSVLFNEACEMLMEGVGKREDIDLVMREGLGLAYGPFEMADRVGLDKVERWMENLYREFGDMRYKPSPILKKLVRANQLGKKNHKGFYEYDENGRKKSISTYEAHE
ncbi:MAG: 3-hydroxyacyl-CoA dehydrogenase family protein [Bacteroidales bacterium]